VNITEHHNKGNAANLLPHLHDLWRAVRETCTAHGMTSEQAEETAWHAAMTAPVDMPNQAQKAEVNQ